MDKKIILSIFAIVIIASFIFCADSFARDCPNYRAGCGAPDIYEVTMNQLEVSTSGSETNAITVVTTPQTFDIAQANAGAVVGSWFSGTTLPPGTYNWMRRTVSRTFSGKGYVNANNFDWYTCSSPDTANFGSETNLCREAEGTYTFVGSDVPSDYAEVTFTAATPPVGVSLPAGMSFTATSIVEEDTSETIPVVRGQSTTMKITFNVSNTLELEQYDPINNPTYYKLNISEPDVAMEITTQ